MFHRQKKKKKKKSRVIFIDCNIFLRLLTQEFVKLYRSAQVATMNMGGAAMGRGRPVPVGNLVMPMAAGPVQSVGVPGAIHGGSIGGGGVTVGPGRSGAGVMGGTGASMMGGAGAGVMGGAGAGMMGGVGAGVMGGAGAGAMSASGGSVMGGINNVMSG